MSANAPITASLRKVTRSLAAATSALVLAAATAFAPIASMPAQAKSGSKSYIRITEANAHVPKLIRLGLDKSLVLDLPADAHDILVANPTVADAVTRSSRRIYVFGKQVGQTNIFVFDGRGQQIAAMEIIIERDIAGLEETLERLIPNSDIRAEMINDNIVLTGSVATPADSAKAVQLAQVFVRGGEATQGQALLRNGAAPSSNSLFADPPESTIVNLLRIDGEDQVHLKVQIVEVQRSIIKQLGFTSQIANTDTNLFSERGSNGFNFQTFARGTPLTSAVPVAGMLDIVNGVNSLRSQITALESTGMMRMLAEPSLTAISGETAHFKAGGEYQVPRDITQDDDGARVQFETVDYGVSLSFTPVVLTEGRISLKLETAVREPSPTGSSSLRSDINLPGIRQRQASTTVELPSGGSMVIGGLIQDDVRSVVSGFPGLKKIPLLGTLFRSREFIRNESEVMIVVTPYLVRPIARNKVVRPDQNLQPASDSAGYLLGRINRVYGTKQGDLPKGRYTGSIGFILK